MSEPGERMALERALAELQSPEPEARVRAIRRLRVIGGAQAIAAIMGALDDPAEEVRARAGIALGQMGAREIVPVLIERLKGSPSDEVREICVFALAEIGDPRAVPPLIDALQDPSEVVVRIARAALVRLRQSDSGERRAAPQGAEDRRKAFAMAMAELPSSDPQTRARAVTRLFMVGGPEAATALINALDDPAAVVRSRAAMSLGPLGVRGSVPALILAQSES